MAKIIHVAVGSTTSKPGDVAGNLRQIAAFAAQAGKDGVDILLTPELSATGYGGYDDVVATAEAAGKGPIYRELAVMAKTNNVAVCAGFAELNGDKRHLAHYAVFPDGSFVVQRKHRVTRVELPLAEPFELVPEPNEKDPAIRGQPVKVEFNYFEVRGVRCAISICADGGITNLGEILAKAGVELLLGPAGAGGRIEERVHTADLQTEDGRGKYLKLLEMVFFPGRGVTDCIKYGRALAAVNMCGYDGRKFAHLGHGMIITPMGEVPAFFHGIPNLDRQRPMYAHAAIDVAERVVQNGTGRLA